MIGFGAFLSFVLHNCCPAMCVCWQWIIVFKSWFRYLFKGWKFGTPYLRSLLRVINSCIVCFRNKKLKNTSREDYVCIKTTEKRIPLSQITSNTLLLLSTRVHARTSSMFLLAEVSDFCTLETHKQNTLIFFFLTLWNVCFYEWAAQLICLRHFTWPHLHF